jgi:mRNA-degrading endonuclease RelE of RelBE toxin-antitoxin system
MPTTVNIPPQFEKDLKQLRRKYPAVTTEVRKLVVQLENDERPGDRVPNVGYEVYKVRLPNPSARRGTSGGFRVIYYVQLVDSIILLTLYSKTEQSDISPEAIRQVLEEITSLDDDESDNSEESNDE